MKVLGIDTATPLGVVGLIDDERSVLDRRISIRPGGGERIPALIDELLKTVHWSPSDIDLVVTGIGPGSYTGIRVGLALARSIAFGLSRPLVGVSTEEVMAAYGDHNGGLTAVLMDARRGEVYATLAKSTSETNILMGPEIIPIDRVIKDLNNRAEPVFLLGDGARIYHNELIEGLKVPVRWGEAEMESPSGSILARIGLNRWISKREDEIDSCEPLYLRKVEAEVRLMERRKMTT